MAEIEEYQAAHNAIMDILIGNGVVQQDEKFAAQRLGQEVAATVPFLDLKAFAGASDPREAIRGQLEDLASCVPPGVYDFAKSFVESDFQPGSQSPSAVMGQLKIDGDPESMTSILEHSAMTGERLGVFKALVPEL